MLTPAEFESIREEICTSGPASGNDNLLGMEIDACAYLGDPAYADDDPGLWSGMEVRRPGIGEWLITGRASGRAGDAPAIAVELARIWERHLRYSFRSAHMIVAAPDSVVLRAGTQIGPGGIWVTAEIRVDLSERRPESEPEDRRIALWIMALSPIIALPIALFEPVTFQFAAPTGLSDSDYWFHYGVWLMIVNAPFALALLARRWKWARRLGK